MQKFLSLLFSRRALAVVGVLVLALLVWFVGPLVSFDTLRPLASVGSRVVTIALLLMLLVLWLVNWSMSIIGISVLCLAIWLRHTAAGPGRCPSVCAVVGSPDPDWFHPVDVRAVRPVPAVACAAYG